MHDVWLCIPRVKCVRLVGQTIGWSSQVRLNAHPRMRRWMATVFAGSEDRVANRSRIVSNSNFTICPFPPDPIFTFRNKHPGQNRKAIPTLRFAPLLPDPIFTPKSGHPGQNRKVGILKRE